MRRFAAFTVLIGLCLLRPPPARPHAFLDHAEPRVGSSVAASPATVTLTFTEAVEAAFSRVEVLDEKGGPLQVGALEHPSPETLTVSLPRLAPGIYTVHWSVVSVDTHPTEGRFTFTVKTPPA